MEAPNHRLERNFEFNRDVLFGDFIILLMLMNFMFFRITTFWRTCMLAWKIWRESHSISGDTSRRLNRSEMVST